MANRSAMFGWMLLLAAGTAGAQAPPAAPRAENARLEPRAIAGSLRETVEAWSAAAESAAWLGYEVPAASGEHQTCCDDGEWNGGSCGACKLEGSRHSNVNLRREKVDLEGPQRILVLLRAEGRKIGRIRVVSGDCTLDAGGLTLVWLSGVNPRDSVRFLEGFVDGREFDQHGREQAARGALAAIALHGDPAADEALARFTAKERPEALRREAAFWSGEARGAAGLALLRKMAASDPSPEVRGQVAFALSVSRESGALGEMIRMARGDSSGHVRGQALFWLAQKAGNRVAQTITGAIDNDPDTEVKKKAVFALSQMPGEEGVPRLIEVARSNRNPEVRKQAMFWLGQSHDPRALDFFEQVLAN